MTELQERGSTVWGWVIKTVSFGVFVYIALFRGSEVNFGIAFLAISAATLPFREFGGFLRSWWGKRGSDEP